MLSTISHVMLSTSNKEDTGGHCQGIRSFVNSYISVNMDDG